MEHFSKVFFTKNKYAQEKLRIVGPVRFRTIHTNLEDYCLVSTKLNKCYYQTMDVDTNLRKDTIDGVEFWDQDKTGISHTIVGENAEFPPVGYVLDVYPDESTPEQFQEIISQKKEMLYGDSARGLNLEMTLYFPRSDWWCYV